MDIVMSRILSPFVQIMIENEFQKGVHKIYVRIHGRAYEFYYRTFEIFGIEFHILIYHFTAYIYSNNEHNEN